MSSLSTPATPSTPASASERAGLVVENLGIRARGKGGGVIVSDVSFAIQRGEAVGIVGESGSGKSMVLRAIMALLPVGVEAHAGSVTLDGARLPHDPRGHAARALRRGIGLVLQDPGAALDPLIPVGTQVAEVLRFVAGRDRAQAEAEARDLLQRVHLPDIDRCYRSYPHELSGGQRQRVVIARALAADPVFLLCDEPTTALDVTVQAEILALLDELRRESSVGLVFVSHDLAVVARTVSALLVMHRGRVVEHGDARQVLTAPAHPYTQALLQAAIDLTGGIGREARA